MNFTAYRAAISGTEYAFRLIMPRIPRYLLVDLGSTNHCTYRSHNLMPLFSEESVAREFLRLLNKYKERYGIAIYSYCLMSTHPHILLNAKKGQQAFSNFWKSVNQGIARFFNKKHDRKGQVVMERLRSPTIMSGLHCLTVMRYIDLNPVRAGLVRSAKDWKYSSYRHYAFGEKDPLIDDAPEYVALGSNFIQRRMAYQGFYGQKPGEHLLKKQREFTLAPFIGHGTWLYARLLSIGKIPRPEG